MDYENVIRELDSSIVRKLAQMWGGRMPTWEEFKLAHERGVVRTNKSLAYKVFWDVGVPKFRALVFGFIIPVVGALIVLAAPVVLSIMGKLSYWLIPVIWILGSWLLFKVCAIAACEAVKDRAVRNQKIYESLVKRGGFSFAPEELASQVPNFGRSKQ